MEQMKHYQPSGALRAAKAFLAGMQKVVPAPLFNPFYNTAFPIYKQAVRHGYLRFLLNADSKRRKKVRLVYQMMPYSLVGWRGLETTYDIVASVLDKRVAGAIVECGVAQGGCAALMASLAAEEGIGRKIWLFDSYEGLPEPTEQDFADGKTGRHVQPLTKGACLGTYEQVSALLFDTLKLDRNCIFMLNVLRAWSFISHFPVIRTKTDDAKTKKRTATDASISTSSPAKIAATSGTNTVEHDESADVEHDESADVEHDEAVDVEHDEAADVEHEESADVEHEESADVEHDEEAVEEEAAEVEHDEVIDDADAHDEGHDAEEPDDLQHRIVSSDEHTWEQVDQEHE